MFKKVLTTTVLGVSALGTMFAYAAAPGIYATGQLGYADTHMGSKLDLNNLPSSVTTDKSNLSNSGLAGRLAVGYQFNPYSAVELGYLQLGSDKANVTDLKAGGGKVKLNQDAIDIAGKGIIPLSCGLNLYGKLGAAYVTTTVKGKLEDSYIPVTADFNGVVGVNKHQWAPEAAIGASYDITPHVSVDTSWTHIQPLGNKSPGNIDFVAVGVGYNFG